MAFLHGLGCIFRAIFCHCECQTHAEPQQPQDAWLCVVDQGDHTVWTLHSSRRRAQPASSNWQQKKAKYVVHFPASGVRAAGKDQAETAEGQGQAHCATGSTTVRNHGR